MNSKFFVTFKHFHECTHLDLLNVKKALIVLCCMQKKILANWSNQLLFPSLLMEHQHNHDVFRFHINQLSGIYRTSRHRNSTITPAQNANRKSRPQCQAQRRGKHEQRQKGHRKRKTDPNASIFPPPPSLFHVLKNLHHSASSSLKTSSRPAIRSIEDSIACKHVNRKTEKEVSKTSPMSSKASHNQLPLPSRVNPPVPNPLVNWIYSTRAPVVLSSGSLKSCHHPLLYKSNRISKIGDYLRSCGCKLQEQKKIVERNGHKPKLYSKGAHKSVLSIAIAPDPSALNVVLSSKTPFVKDEIHLVNREPPISITLPRSFRQTNSGSTNANHSVDKPTANHSVDKPTANHSVDKPTANHSVDKPTANHSVDKPTANHSVGIPTATMVSLKPLTTDNLDTLSQVQLLPKPSYQGFYRPNILRHPQKMESNFGKVKQGFYKPTKGGKALVDQQTSLYRKESEISSFSNHVMAKTKRRSSATLATPSLFLSTARHSGSSFIQQNIELPAPSGRTTIGKNNSIKYENFLHTLSEDDDAWRATCTTPDVDLPFSSENKTEHMNETQFCGRSLIKYVGPQSFDLISRFARKDVCSVFVGSKFKPPSFEAEVQLHEKKASYNTTLLSTNKSTCIAPSPLISVNQKSKLLSPERIFTLQERNRDQNHIESQFGVPVESRSKITNTGSVETERRADLAYEVCLPDSSEEHSSKMSQLLGSSTTEEMILRFSEAFDAQELKIHTLETERLELRKQMTEVIRELEVLKSNNLHQDQTPTLKREIRTLSKQLHLARCRNQGSKKRVERQQEIQEVNTNANKSQKRVKKLKAKLDIMNRDELKFEGARNDEQEASYQSEDLQKQTSRFKPLIKQVQNVATKLQKAEFESFRIEDNARNSFVASPSHSSLSSFLPTMPASTSNVKLAYSSAIDSSSFLDLQGSCESRTSTTKAATKNRYFPSELNGDLNKITIPEKQTNTNLDIATAFPISSCAPSFNAPQTVIDKLYPNIFESTSCNSSGHPLMPQF